MNKEIEFMLKLANDLQNEAHQYKYDRQTRIDKLMGKYKVLYENKPGLFMAAIMEELNKPQIQWMIQSYYETNGEKEAFDKKVGEKMYELFEQQREQRCKEKKNTLMIENNNSK